MSDPNSSVSVAPAAAPVGTAGDNRERIVILQKISGDPDPSDPNRPPVWTPVPISAANYREVLKNQIRPHVVDAVPDPENPEVILAINVVLDAPAAEIPQMLCDQVPELKEDRDRLAALTQLEGQLLKRTEVDGKLGELASELFGNDDLSTTPEES